MIPNWEMIFSQYEANCISKKSWNRCYRNAVRSLVDFLERGSHTYLGREVMVLWLKERSARCTLGGVMTELYSLKKFIYYLSEHGLCMQDLLSRLRAETTLLDQLPGPHRYVACVSQPHVYWQAILSDFELSLRGYTPLYIGHILRTASECAVLLQKHDKTFPDQDTFLEWLDGRLARCKDSTIESLLYGLEKFCHFFQKRGDCHSNPVAQWRREHLSIRDGLTRRREGKPPQGHPPRFQSVLSTLITAFIDHKRSLGYTYESVPVLEYLDRYLREHNVETLSDIDERFLLDFLGTFPHWKDSTRRKAFLLLRKFFRFLERRGEIDQHRSPARCLPHVVRHPYIPHIYTVKEIVTILSELQNTRYRHDFDARTVATLIFLIYACGLRISEAVKLQVEDVNLGEKTLFIRRTKFGKSRLIPFGHRAAEYLVAYQRLRNERLGEPGAGDFFFVRSIGRPCSKKSLENLFREACRRAGIRTHSGHTPRIHDIRHSFAVHRLYKWYQDGADPQERLIFLSLYMGHVSIESTQYYLHLSSDLLQLAGRPLEGTLDQLLQERQVLYNDE